MKRILIAPVFLAALFAGGATRVVQDQCGPFTDVTPAFCPYILELYYLGITAGTSATTFSPDDPLTRGQGAVFVAKGLNQALARSSRRAALGQWWTGSTGTQIGLGVTNVGSSPRGVAFDGADLWVAASDGTVSRVRASDGALLGTWTGAVEAYAVLVAMGRVFVSSAPAFSPIQGKLYMIDPSQAPGAVTTVVEDMGMNVDPAGLSFDGSRIWANSAFPGSPGVAIITPAASPPWPVTVVNGNDFGNGPGIVFDGGSMWATAGFGTTGSLLRMHASGSVVQTVRLPAAPSQGSVAFDGSNVWVPLVDNRVAVVSAASGTIVQTLTGNGLSVPLAVSFDGQRMAVTNGDNASVSIFRSADLSPLEVFPLPFASSPTSVCSDGVDFWITLGSLGQLARL